MITLQFSTEKWSIASATIRYFTWSDYSHVDFVLPDGHLLGARTAKDRAAKSGVQIRPPHYSKFLRTLIATVDAPDAVLQTAMSQIGKPYDRTGIIQFFRHGSRDWREADSWFCSELVAWAFEQNGIYLLNPRLYVMRVTPRDVLASPLLKY